MTPMTLVKCPHPKCQAENAHDAEFCRVCGRKMHVIAEFEKFPEYSLKPANLFKKTTSHHMLPANILMYLSVCWCIFFMGIAVISLCIAISNSDSKAFWGTFFGVCMTIPAILIFFFLHRFRKSQNTCIINIDYIQTKWWSIDSISWNLFFIKNSKFGIITINNWSGKAQIQLPAIYDYVEWYKKNEMLRVYKDNRWYIVDINGKCLK